MLDEPAEQAIEVYLPPSYANSQLHYPVVYFLPGFGSNSDGNNNFFPVDEIATLMANKQISEMILVVPNGANILHGSFYVNSPVTGNWEDFIVNDVIKYVDSQYRTLPKPEGRANWRALDGRFWGIQPGDAPSRYLQRRLQPEPHIFQGKWVRDIADVRQGE